MSTNSEPVLLVEVSGGLATLTLNRPQAMNALSSELRVALSGAIDKLCADPSVRVLILTGAGRAFSAGLDLKELGSGASQIGGVLDGGNVVKSLSRFQGPIIGAINGAAITGGFELALACDVLIASSTARFADTHVRVGVMPGWGLSQKLSRAIGISRAKELSLTGNFLSAEQAERWGLVNRVVAPEELMPAARALAQDMLSTIPENLIAYKKLIDEGFGQDFATAMQTEQRIFKAAAKSVSSESIEQRRGEIQQRGQSQAQP
ncbi:MAG TPA: enoyl-CoA hydratase [Alphaproteobacteria bacterium]|nr:enoyl-CoA hydratase [Alphaproteobacteria bacterium]